MNRQAGLGQRAFDVIEGGGIGFSDEHLDGLLEFVSGHHGGTPGKASDTELDITKKSCSIVSIVNI